VVIREAALTGSDTGEDIFTHFGAPFGNAKILGQSHFGGNGRGDILARSDTLFLDGVQAVPATVVVTEQPGDQLANTDFTLRAQILSADDRLVPFGASQAVLDFYNNPNGAVLNGTLSQPFTGGEAIFNGLSLDRAGNDYALSLEPSG